MIERRVIGYLKLSGGGMPQDIRISPKGDVFYVADMHADGVFVIDGESFHPDRSDPHRHRHPRPLSEPRRHQALRDEPRLPQHARTPHAATAASAVLDFATRKMVANWPIPGGGSPDMGNVSADGKTLWLSGRFDNEVYAIDTADGTCRRSRSAPSRTASPYGRSPAATRSGTRATCGDLNSSEVESVRIKVAVIPGPPQGGTRNPGAPGYDPLDSGFAQKRAPE